MHDLVRDMALRITNGNSKLNMGGNVPRFLVRSLGWRCSKVILEQKEWTEDLHAVFFFHSFAEIKFPSTWSPNCPKLSTLLLPDLFIKRIPDSCFWHMCGLKVLNLRGCGDMMELPNSVSCLVNLTTLILRHCRDLRSVPPLGELNQLRELDLYQTNIEDFPQGWESLVNLERLDLGRCMSFKRSIIPKGTFYELHSLHRLVLPHRAVQFNDLEGLNQLETFIGGLCFTDLYEIYRWPKYYNLYVSDDFSYDDHSGFWENVDYDGKGLYFYECNLGRGSKYPALLLPSNMKSLKLVRCVGMGIRCLSDAFKNFLSLNDLSSLVILGLDRIEFLWQFSSSAPRDQLVNSSFSPLRNLEVLQLRDLPDLVCLFFGESEAYLLPPGTFSSLARLSIYRCHNVKQLFTVQLLQNLQNLEYLEIKSCGGLEEIAGDDNGVGQGGGEGIQLTSTEATATVILPKLSGLYLSGLPQLKNICKTAMICDSIEEINMFGCPKVKRLPLFLPTINGLPSPPSTLLRIEGDAKWWESLEWDNPCTKNALDPFFTAS